MDLISYAPDNSLWPRFVEHIGIERSKNAVRDAINLQSMTGNTNTIPVLLYETCGMALMNTDVLLRQTGLNFNSQQVLFLLSTKEKIFQILHQR